MSPDKGKYLYLLTRDFSVAKILVMWSGHEAMRPPPKEGDPKRGIRKGGPNRETTQKGRASVAEASARSGPLPAPPLSDLPLLRRNLVKLVFLL